MAAAMLLRRMLAAAAAAIVAGCAMPVGQVAIEKPASSALAPGLSPQAAQARVVAGQTKAQVAAALGPATVVHFDSGYEVWVYQQKDARADREPDELVVLFSPSGVATKTRVRLGAPLRRER